ncbi:MAG: SRPBCC domain-containing protein [Nocardioidaceae bacterium]
MSEAGVLEVWVHIKAPIETVFPFFTDPERYAQWMGTEATVEAAPGGAYHVRMRDGVEAAGEFVEIDAPKRIVFTWGWVGDDVVAPGSTRVEVTLSEDGQSGTDVVLRHFGLSGTEQIEHHTQGWELYLARLSVAASGGDPGPDPNA